MSVIPRPDPVRAREREIRNVQYWETKVMAPKWCGLRYHIFPFVMANKLEFFCITRLERIIRDNVPIIHILYFPLFCFCVAVGQFSIENTPFQREYVHPALYILSAWNILLLAYSFFFGRFFNHGQFMYNSANILFIAGTMSSGEVYLFLSRGLKEFNWTFLLEMHTFMLFGFCCSLFFYKLVTMDEGTQNALYHELVMEIYVRRRSEFVPNENMVPAQPEEEVEEDEQLLVNSDSEYDSAPEQPVSHVVFYIDETTSQEE